MCIWKRFYTFKRLPVSEKEKEIYKRMGFYLIKISKHQYYVYFEYLENLIKKAFIAKKKEFFDSSKQFEK